MMQLGSNVVEEAINQFHTPLTASRAIFPELYRQRVVHLKYIINTTSGKLKHQIPFVCITKRRQKEKIENQMERSKPRAESRQSKLTPNQLFDKRVSLDEIFLSSFTSADPIYLL